MRIDLLIPNSLYCLINIRWKTSFLSKTFFRHLGILIPLLSILCSCTEHIKNLHSNKSTLKAFEKFEISFTLPISYKNPYDPNEIEVSGIFTDPDGEKITVPGFWYEGFEVNEQAKKISPSEVKEWKVRFTPTAEGNWTYKVQATDQTGSKISEQMSFSVTAAAPNEGGFIKRHSEHNRYFFYEKSGKTFFGAGLNSDVNAFLRTTATDPENKNWGKGSRYKPPWTGMPSTGLTAENVFKGYAYQKNIVNSMGQNGGKALRFIADIYYHPLEAKGDLAAYESFPFGEMGLEIGRYNQEMSFILDQVYEHAEKYDIGIIHTVWDAITKETFSAGESYAKGKNDELIKRRLRYTMARWGYSTSHWITEFFNEYDHKYDPYWRGITNWMKTVDPYGHGIIFTSSGHGGDTGPDAFVLHTYDGSCWNIGEPENPNFPALMGEFGGDWKMGTADIKTFDPEGNWVRQTHWNALVSNWSGALTWWTHPFYGERGANAYNKIYPALTNFLEKENMVEEAPWAVVSEIEVPIDLAHVSALSNHNQTKYFVWIVRTPPTVVENRSPVNGRSIKIPVPDGEYTIEWWDSLKGEIISTKTLKAENGKLLATIPNGLTRDIAAKILKKN